MPACSLFQVFAAELHQVFKRGSSRDAAVGELVTLQQGQQSVMYFAVDFRIVARRSRWSRGPLTDVFLHGLADHIRDLLLLLGF